MNTKERQALKETLLDLLARDNEVAEALVLAYRRGLPLRNERERQELAAREREQEAREAARRAQVQAIVQAAEAQRGRVGEAFFGRVAREGETFSLPIYATGQRAALDELSRTLAEERRARDEAVAAAIRAFEQRRGA